LHHPGAHLNKLSARPAQSLLATAMPQRVGVLASLHVAPPGILRTDAVAGALIALAGACLVARLLWRNSKLQASLSSTRRDRDRIRTQLIALETVAIEREIGAALVQEGYTRMNRILDSTSEGIFKLSFDWTVVYTNRPALRDDILQLGNSYWDCYPAARGTIIEECFTRTMQDRIATEFENFWAPNGEWYSVHCYPIEGGMSVFFTPVTARKLLEQELKRENTLRKEREDAAALANERLSHILDSTSEGVMKLDPQWNILYENLRARDISPGPRAGLKFWDCYPGVQGTEVEAHLRSCMEDRKEVQYETVHGPKDERFSVRAFPTPRGMSLFYRAITAERKLEDQLDRERALREKRIEALSNMAGGLAHEISNLLAIIYATANDLQSLAETEAVLASSDVIDASATIVKTSDRAIRILRGLRGFAREAGNDPMEYASAAEIVEQAVQMQEARFARHDIELRVEVPADTPPILCRGIQIGQIVTNLLNNAYDALVERNCVARWVLVSVRSAGERLELEVVDSGMGVAEGDRTHLMEAFFTTKTRGAGMGIGLSLSRAIAEEHGGTLEFCPDAANTCFRLTLPAPAPAHTPQPSPSAPPRIHPAPGESSPVRFRTAEPERTHAPASPDAAASDPPLQAQPGHTR
jgi:signal transduction histidine kinase/PAS domain-containing protein